MDDFALPQAALATRYAVIRAHTEALAAGLTTEDQCVQSMPDTSPTKWHRAHTTWFFEQFLLREFAPDYLVFDSDFQFLFNSYYEAVGARHPRPIRGLLTRPSADKIAAYRVHVDASMAVWAHAAPRDLAELGLQHEQQHQELLLTDILHAFAQNPLAPAAQSGWREPPAAPGPTRFVRRPGGIVRVGHAGDSVRVGHAGDGFCFDNELPAHDALLRDYAIADRLVRNREWADFIADGGYRTPSLWMSDGWAEVQAQGWAAPLYWRDGGMQMGLGGLAPIDPDAPVRHIAWYEADAFARWSGARLPTEFEWEAAAPVLREATGHVWQWTDSAYRPYPGYKPPPGAIGEYNGKFMINQMVLRGGSIATPPAHTRLPYRNFFHPDKRWQFSGLRLTRDL